MSDIPEPEPLPAVQPLPPVLSAPEASPVLEVGIAAGTANDVPVTVDAPSTDAMMAASITPTQVGSANASAVNPPSEQLVPSDPYSIPSLQPDLGDAPSALPATASVGPGGNPPEAPAEQKPAEISTKDEDLPIPTTPVNAGLGEVITSQAPINEGLLPAMSDQEPKATAQANKGIALSDVAEDAIALIGDLQSAGVESPKHQSNDSVQSAATAVTAEAVNAGHSPATPSTTTGTPDAPEQESPAESASAPASDEEDPVSQGTELSAEFNAWAKDNVATPPSATGSLDASGVAHRQVKELHDEALKPDSVGTGMGDGYATEDGYHDFGDSARLETTVLAENYTNATEYVPKMQGGHFLYGASHGGVQATGKGGKPATQRPSAGLLTQRSVKLHQRPKPAQAKAMQTVLTARGMRMEGNLLAYVLRLGCHDD
jgi:hypothetical protein